MENWKSLTLENPLITLHTFEFLSFQVLKIWIIIWDHKKIEKIF